MAKLFKEKFKGMIENQEFKVHICQLTYLKNELEAMVILYFLPTDARRLVLNDCIDYEDAIGLKKIPFINSKIKDDAA